MDKEFVKDNIEAIFESFKKMIKVETVVGQPMEMGDAIIVPFVNVTLGFGTGGTGKEKTERAGGAGGAKLEPMAVLVIKGERVELFSLRGDCTTSGFDRLIGMVPELITKMKKEKYIYINDEQ